MIAVEGGWFHLGEDDKGLLERYAAHHQLGKRWLRVRPFCVAEYPFPNRAGVPWPADGLRIDQLPAVEARVEPFGRRLCTVDELLLVGAGPDNWRHPHDPARRLPGRCEPYDLAEGMVLGAYAGCVNAQGVHDLGVRSSWARINDPAIARDLRAGWLTDRGPSVPLPDLPYAVWGGTARDDTFYAPGNFGIHTHGIEGPFVDDGLRLCATPRPSWRDDGWSTEVDAFIEHSRFDAWLD